MQQLWGGISSISFWNGKRAIAYRRIENIPDEDGNGSKRADPGFRQYGRHQRDRKAQEIRATEKINFTANILSTHREKMSLPEYGLQRR